MFYALRLVFSCTEGVGSCFIVLRARTHFRRYRGRRLPFSSFAHPNSFSVVPRASGLVFKFCSAGLIVPRALPKSFPAIPRVFGPVAKFCAPKVVSRDTEGVWSRCLVLRTQTHFRRYREHRVQISCFALPDSFSTVPRASNPVFMFCAPRLVFSGTVRVGSSFHILRSRTHFRR
jgi:hypothetical protein